MVVWWREQGISVVSVKEEDNADVPDLNSSNYSINLPQVDPKSTTSKNGSGKYVKVEIFLEPREVAFLSPSKICNNLNFFY